MLSLDVVALGVPDVHAAHRLSPATCSLSARSTFTRPLGRAGVAPYRGDLGPGTSQMDRPAGTAYADNIGLDTRYRSQTLVRGCNAACGR